MKKLIMWIPLLLLSFKSFSQTDTPYVRLTTEQAREVIKDLLAGDAAKKQVSLQSAIIIEKDSIIVVKDSLIESQKEKIHYGIQTITNLQGLSEAQDKQIEALEDSFKKANRRRKFFKTGFVVASVALTTLILTN